MNIDTLKCINSTIQDLCRRITNDSRRPEANKQRAEVVHLLAEALEILAGIDEPFYKVVEGNTERLKG